MDLEQSLRNAKRDPHFNRIPALIADALATRDSRYFYQACEKTGFMPQDEEQRMWYSEGYALSTQSMLRVTPTKTAVQIDEREKYRLFLRDMERGKDMRYTLIKYFPGRFGPEGSQSIKEYSDDKLYGLSQGVIKSARKFLST